ncbi:MAG TPA: Type 1 glutamine amidotransferase-like domain-containing protein [Candidatus Saccharimonadales bacterium]|nr:Type 1 glutamine amidotransferase-like domain-containing protein [Candidatus Saccharimonadales bacterium]
MKLLLTSGGIQNEAIKLALTNLLGKQINQAIVCYIPTAAIGDLTPHDWFVTEIKKAYDIGWKEFNLVDLSLPKDVISERIQKSDVVYVEGGNLYYLAEVINKNNLQGVFQNIFESNRVYVGVSAGSMIFCKNISVSSAKLFGEETHLDASHAKSPFNLFNWYLKPHLYSKEFPDRTDSWIEKIAAKANFPIYAIDDDSAIQVLDDKVEVISEGKWRLFE